jgi:hypothetical protein
MKTKILLIALILTSTIISAQWNSNGNNSTTGNIIAQNPNNTQASVNLGWFNDIARLRIGGLGNGVSNGFEIQSVSNRTIFKVTDSGNVGIGTTNPDEKLTVKGKIHAEEVRVDLSVPADYVFQKYYTGASLLKETYKMPTLEEVAAFTKKNHHLPEVPSAAQIQKEGLHLKQMTNLLLQKIEELTIYTIEQEKRINALESKLLGKKS